MRADIAWNDMKVRMMRLSIDQLQKTALSEGIDLTECSDKEQVVDAIIAERKAQHETDANDSHSKNPWRESNAIAFRDTERPLPDGWERQWEDMRDELSKRSVKELKQLAKSEGISLGYSAARKDSTVLCIVTNRRNRALEEYRGAVRR